MTKLSATEFVNSTLSAREKPRVSKICWRLLLVLILRMLFLILVILSGYLSKIDEKEGIFCQS
jgi:hypothetical protein